MLPVPRFKIYAILNKLQGCYFPYLLFQVPPKSMEQKLQNALYSAHTGKLSIVVSNHMKLTDLIVQFHH